MRRLGKVSCRRSSRESQDTLQRHLQNEGKCQDALVKFFHPRRQSYPDKAASCDIPHQLETRSTSLTVELLCTLWKHLRGLVEDSHVGLHQGLGSILVCQAGGRLSSSTVIENVVRKDVSSYSWTTGEQPSLTPKRNHMSM